MAYRVVPYQKEEKKDDEPVTNDFAARLDAIESKINQLVSGGKFDGLL